MSSYIELYGATIASYGATFLAGAAAVVASQHLRAKPANEMDQKIREIFNDLRITDWHLPQFNSSTIDIASKFSGPKPIFNQKTQEEITLLSQRMIKSRENEGKTPLPNIVLNGVPGVGKTMLLENICLEADIPFIHIPPGVMESHLKTGNHINALHKIMSVVNLSNLPVMTIWNDAEEAFAKRGDVTSESNTKNDDVKTPWADEKKRMSSVLVQRHAEFVNTLLELSGQDVRKVAFGITTNRFQRIDPAFITRAHMITIKLPDEAERKKIIVTHLPNVFSNDNQMLSFFDQRILSSMAKKTEGFTGRDIVRTLEELSVCAQIEGGINEDAIDATIVTRKGSVKPKEDANESKGQQTNALSGFAQRIQGAFRG